MATSSPWDWRVGGQNALRHGSVTVSVHFKCIVFRLIKDEVIEAEVTDVMFAGFLAACGPTYIFVPKKEMQGFGFRLGSSSEYNIFSDSSSVIAPKVLVRRRVLGTRWMPLERAFKAIRTLNGDMLGHVFEDAEYN